MKRWYRRLDGLMKAQCSERILCALLLVGVAITLIPVLWVGTYSAPYADDYAYGTATHIAWKHTGSLLAVLRAAVQTVVRYYNGWQGTFSAIFLMSLQPAVFGGTLYWIVPFLMVGLLALGEFFFSWAIFRRCFHATRSQFLTIGGVWLLFSVQLSPCAVEGFCWYNGAIYYTGYFAFSLVYFGLMLCYITTEARPVRRGVNIGLLAVLGIVIGGGNFVTALITLVVTVLAVVICATVHRREWKGLLLPVILLAVAFGVSVKAPGNAVRQAICESTSVWYAIYNALVTGVISIGDNVDVLHLLMFAALGGVFWKITERTKFSFPMPLLVGVLSFGVYSAQYSPTLYAMNDIGPGRLQNIIYDMFLLLAMGNLFYVLGWIRRRFFTEKQKDKRPKLGYAWWKLAVLGVSMLFCCAVPRDTPITTLSALASLRSGEAEQYHQEYLQRHRLLEDEQTQNVVIQHYASKPYLLYLCDASYDPECWANIAISNYYEKESVIVQYPE